MAQSRLIRAATPAEYERVGDLTVTAYAALPVDHLFDGYDDQIRAVDDAVRGRGIGEALVEFCIARAREQARTILLHTTQHMPAAQRLYARMGFTRRPDRDVHDFEAEHDMTFLAFTFDPGGATPAG